MMAAQEKNIHEGHRARLRERFIAEGLDGFDEHTALELLLCYAIPRRDVNEQAHSLIEHFGSIANVFDAPVDELMKVDGLGELAAALIKLVPQMNRKYQMSRLNAEKNVELSDVTKAGRYFMPYFYALTEECVYMASLDPKCRLISCRKIFSGNEAFASVTLKKVIEMAVKEHAFSVILAHNHPKGTAVPSVEDVQSTRRIAETLKTVDINLIDHIIVCGNEFTSMAECGYFR